MRYSAGVRRAYLKGFLRMHKLIRVLGALIALLALSDSCSSQTTARYKIGWLKVQTRMHAPEELKAFVESLRERGHIEGTTFEIEARYADGDSSQLRPLVDDLVRSGVDVILATSQPVLDAAYGATRTMPIVARMSDDPVRTGMARSLDSPAGNVTGIFSSFEEMSTTRITQLHRAVPDLRKVGLLLTLTMVTRPFGSDRRGRPRPS